MKRVYLSLLFIALGYFLADIAFTVIFKPKARKTLTFSATKSAIVEPDSLSFSLSHREPFESSLAGAFTAVHDSMEKTKILAEHEEALTLDKANFTCDKSDLQNLSGIARRYIGESTANATISDIAKTPLILKSLFENGNNQIGSYKYAMSPQSASALRKRLRDEAKIAAELKAKETVKRLGKFDVTACAPALFFEPGFGGGSGAGSGGMGLGGSSSIEEVDIKTLIVNLNQMTIPEPDFKGPVEIATTLVPPSMEFTESFSVTCELVVN